MKIFGVTLSALDEGVGKVVEALKEAGIYDNTLIVFSTDNGGQASKGASNYPLRGNKDTLFEAGMYAYKPVRSITLLNSMVLVVH